MARQSLAVKYRPTSFDDLTEQTAIKEILTNQINTKTFQHGYLFTGPAGTGKTTSARIFASMINQDKGNPIEIDAASNSGVDNIRQVIDDSKRKPLDGEYKIFIIDECHSLSNGAWQAMLKLLEEPPKFSIFILCTTDPQKIPATILSRVQRFQFNKISTSNIKSRLLHILEEEKENINGIKWEDEAVAYIAKVSNGGMRDAITLMDKCMSLSTNVNLENVLDTLGSESYETFFNFLYDLCDRNQECLGTVEDIFNAGKDIKQFLKEFIKFTLDVAKYNIYKNVDYTDIPATDENLDYLEAFTAHEKEIHYILDLLVETSNLIKWDADPKTMIELKLLLYCTQE